MIRVQAAMMHKSVVSLLLIQGVALLKADSALVIGGFGASDSVQVVTDNDVCLGGNAVPMIPKAPDGRVGWTAQYVDGKVVVCGGAKVDFYSDCYSLQIGTKNLFYLNFLLCVLLICFMQYSSATQFLKIAQNVSINIASEASTVYILSGQKFVRNAKNGHFFASS